jgi:hypothetical protein
MTTVTATSVPIESALYSTLPSADFFDAYEAPLRDPALTPAEIFLRTSRATPKWVSRLMAIRNVVVRQIGLKDVGRMNGGSPRPAADYRVGERMGIFDVFAIGERELVLGIDDSHLDVRVSVVKHGEPEAARYTVSTVVHIKNRIGDIYMLPIGRIHPLVVRAMMRCASV